MHTCSLRLAVESIGLLSSCLHLLGGTLFKNDPDSTICLVIHFQFVYGGFGFAGLSHLN